MKTRRVSLKLPAPRDHKRIAWMWLALGLAGFHSQSLGQVNESRYVWEFPVTTGVTNAGPSIQILREEVDRILDAGRLAPLYISIADQDSVGYTLYNEPGRVILTLAWAYPYLTSEQQTAVRAYVQQEFSDPIFSPWGVTPAGVDGDTNFPIPRNAGAPREDHPKERWWYERNDFGLTRPFLFTLYGVWLYGFRTGDWTPIQAAWPTIRDRYLNRADAPAQRIYGGMGAHIAVARMAHRLGDAATMNTALTHLQNALNTGLDFNAVESIARGTPGLEWQSPYGGFPDMYDARMEGTTYRGWMFLNLTPEIGRFLAEESPALRNAVMTRHELGKRIFPLWWLNKVSYFHRNWTGDEGSGLLPEMIGMIAPVERWVVGASPQTLARQMRGSPQGIGDCYWLEALVQAISAHGQTVWRDVRYPPVAFETWRQQTFGAAANDPRASIVGDWDEDGIVNLLERAFGLDPFTPDPPPLRVSISPDGLHLTLTFDHVKEAWDLEYHVEVSGDLKQWQSGPAFVHMSRVDMGAKYRVTATDLTRMDQAPRHFMRLKVLLKEQPAIAP